MAMHLTASITLLLLVLLGVTSEAPPSNETPVTIEVRNSLVPGEARKIYRTSVPYRAILLGAMRRLQETTNFKFTYTEDKNYGPFLTSVNGLYGDFSQRTYWQLLVEKPDGTIIRADVGIGCLIPTENDKILLIFSTY
ncbi:hypothetical protein NQD34_009327 [Periophthalmus magnuspinnatus]|nr:hypothetical protein NQD34_009327 [Periophthalmus magnuspinnatus]